jgi:hypothetical protein
MKINWEAIRKAAAEGKAERAKNLEAEKLASYERDRKIQNLIEDAMLAVPDKVKAAVHSNAPTIKVFAYNTSSLPDEFTHREAYNRIKSLLDEACIVTTEGAGEGDSLGRIGYELYASVNDLCIAANSKP